jgi:hypothetical protein
MMCPIAERIDRALGLRWLDTPGWYSLAPGHWLAVGQWPTPRTA